MKQTVAILTALTLCLMAITGYLVYGSTKEMELMARKDQQLADLYTEVNQVTRERNALNLQLQDAVLSSQEANDAVAMQAQQNEQLQSALEAANMELETLREALANTHQTTSTP